VILWLGITRNERAVQPLLDLIFERDVMGKTITLKRKPCWPSAVSATGVPLNLCSVWCGRDACLLVAVGRS
jgi:hypothetical protein